MTPTSDGKTRWVDWAGQGILFVFVLVRKLMLALFIRAPGMAIVFAGGGLTGTSLICLFVCFSATGLKENRGKKGGSVGDVLRRSNQCDDQYKH